MKISLVLIIYRSNSKIARETASFCGKVLNNQKIKNITFGSDFKQDTINKTFINSEIPDIAIVLGGDGTVLKSSNELINFNIPILSFNIGGQLGFLTQDKQFLFSESFLQLLKNDQFIIDSRSMLKCNINKGNSEEILSHKIKTFFALNDFYFKSTEDDISPTNQIIIEIDNEKVNEYKGDGLIISSATGSTAYSMAAGGPIVHPKINAFVINPICPMSLSNRPIIVPDTSKIIVKTIDSEKRSLRLWKDGTKTETIRYTDYCEITKAKTPTKMISFQNSISYYSTLIQKLNWKGNLSKQNNHS